MSITTVEFNSLVEFNDTESIVMVAMNAPEDKSSLIAEMNEFFISEGIFDQDTEIVDMLEIVNVPSNNPFHKVTNWLLILKSDKGVLPLGRLKFPDLKWTSDFVSNFGE